MQPNVKVYEPFSSLLIVKKWTPEIAFNYSHTLKDALGQADAIFAVINGEVPETGTCVEIGIVTALKKPVFLFRDDFRLDTDSDGILPVNLMLFSGIDMNGKYGKWEDYYYTSLDKIRSPNKAFAKWAKSMNRANSMMLNMKQ